MERKRGAGWFLVESIELPFVFSMGVSEFVCFTSIAVEKH